MGRGGKIIVAKFDAAKTVFTISLEEAEIPSREYPATAAIVEGPVHRPQVIFWQPSRTKGETRSLLEVRVTKECLLNFGPQTAPFLAATAAYMDKHDIATFSGGNGPAEPPVGQAAALAARAVRAQHIDSEIVFDFYQIEATEKGKLRVEPVVRVWTPIEVGFTVVDRLSNYRVPA